MSTREPKFRRRAEARPDEVLDAALSLFTEKGFAATRVEDIAKRAGISKGGVYLYFSSKEAVLEALVRRAVVPIAKSVQQIITGYAKDPRAVLTLALKAAALRMSDDKVLAIPRLMLREMINFPAFAQMYRVEVLDRVLPLVSGLIRSGIEDGHFRAVDPELTVRNIVGPILLHIMLDEVFGIRPEDGLALDRLIDNHLAVLFDGLSAPPKGKRRMSH